MQKAAESALLMQSTSAASTSSSHRRSWRRLRQRLRAPVGQIKPRLRCEMHAQQMQGVPCQRASSSCRRMPAWHISSATQTHTTPMPPSRRSTTTLVPPSVRRHPMHIQAIVEDEPEQVIRRVESGRFAADDACVKAYLKVRSPRMQQLALNMPGAGRHKPAGRRQQHVPGIAAPSKLSTYFRSVLMDGFRARRARGQRPRPPARHSASPSQQISVAARAVR